MIQTPDEETGAEHLELADRLYEQYAKPLEAEHRGEYLAVSREGKTLLASSLVEATKRASEKFGRGNFIFKVGEPSVGEWL